MANYFFLGTLLPNLILGTEPELSLESYTSLLEENLNPSDLRKFSALRRFFDLENIRFFWLQKPLNSFGNYNGNSLEEALLSGVGLSGYIYDFMDKYELPAERLRNFSKLYADFFREEIPKASGFLKALFIEERAVRLVGAALRAKEFKRSILAELQFEEDVDPLVAHILAQKDAAGFEPQEEYLAIKSLYDLNKSQPLALHQALLTYRFQKAEELISLDVFSIDRLLAYYFQLVLVEQWLQLNQEMGQKIINTIVQDIS